MKKEIIIIVCLFLIFIGLGSVLVKIVHNEIENNGGVKQIVIDAGREIRDISEKIKE